MGVGRREANRPNFIINIINAGAPTKFERQELLKHTANQTMWWFGRSTPFHASPSPIVTALPNLRLLLRCPMTMLRCSCSKPAQLLTRTTRWWWGARARVRIPTRRHHMTAIHPTSIMLLGLWMMLWLTGVMSVRTPGILCGGRVGDLLMLLLW